MTTAQTADQSPTTPEAGVAYQQCIHPSCAQTYPVHRVLTACPSCGSLLDVRYRWPATTPTDFRLFELRSGTRGPREAAGTAATRAALDFSGVWRFRDLMPFYEDETQIVTVGEGRTNLQRADHVACELGFDLENGGRLFLQYEGFNPSGSFKDNGMCAAFTHARMVNAQRVACASTGNTSASLAMYAALTGLACYVFIGEGKIAYGKLSQALEYGARTLQVAGDFDACLARVREIADHRPELGVYLMNSVNPFRLEGQKSIMYRILEGLDWEPPDWIIVPGGNLGNSSAFGKAFAELKELGLIKKIPRLAVANAHGARTLDRMVNELGMTWRAPGREPGDFDHAAVDAEFQRMDKAGERAHTVASAIEINRPVNLSKCLRALDTMHGVVRSFDDETIVEHKALVGRWGFGCEPASGASVAAARQLVREGLIAPTDTVACVLTGHLLKDPDVTVGYHTGIDTKGVQAIMSERGQHAEPTGAHSNRPIRVADELEAIIEAMRIKL
ncbi:MAG: threonine synthase [Phycisphaerales bacterium]|nr:MAG: threonine synthase [Phycisphaerales bacterium]